METAVLVDKVDAVPLGRMYQASQRAMVRLQLYVTGSTQEKLIDFGQKARAIIVRRADQEGKLDGMGGFQAQTEMMSAWGETLDGWAREVTKARQEAGRIAFGALAVMHSRMISAPLSASAPQPALRQASPHLASATLAGRVPAGPSVPRQNRGREFQEVAGDGVFEPQLRRLLAIAAEYLYGDGMNLSGRIWRLDRDARDGMNSVILNGVANGSSAWQMAQQLEQFLGASEDCPRWTSTRLYGLTKSEIASGDTRGLLSGEACDGSGVAYQALRLARTEIQKIHSLATDRMLAMQPWVEMEQCNLSAAHPEADECDDVVNGGEGGKGVYPVGSIEYPLHPNCLCYKTSVMMDQKAFTTKLRGWMNGTQQWAEMDDYAKELGAHFEQDLAGEPVVLSLAVWLFGEALQKWLQ